MGIIEGEPKRGLDRIALDFSDGKNISLEEQKILAESIGLDTLCALETQRKASILRARGHSVNFDRARVRIENILWDWDRECESVSSVTIRILERILEEIERG